MRGAYQRLKVEKDTKWKRGDTDIALKAVLEDLTRLGAFANEVTDENEMISP